MEIVPRVHLLPGMRGANVYLLVDNKLTLVDGGMPGSEKAVYDYIESLGLDVRDLHRIVITHHHLDHVGSVAAIKERCSAQVLAHPGDAPFISGEQSPPPPKGAIMRLLLPLMAMVMPKVEPVPISLLAKDGDHLSVLGGATIVHVPGHTPGSIALQFPAERLLICGDVIDHRRDRLGPPPKPFSEDMDQAIASLHRLAELEFEVLCPGHGAPIVGSAGEQVRDMVRRLD